MIVCKNFVYIHQPKTGGTFVRHVLEKIHKRGIRGFLLRGSRKFGLHSLEYLLGYRKIRFPHNPKHAPACFIPPPYCDKLVLGTFRDPLRRYVSEFEFNWHKKAPDEYGVRSKLKERWPGFPDLPFSDFVHFLNKEYCYSQKTAVNNSEHMGFQTQHFVYTYCRNPLRAFHWAEDYNAFKQEVSEQLGSVHFLSTENLSQELYGFLLQQGYSPEVVAFVKEHPKVLPDGSRPHKRHWMDYYSPELLSYVQRRERLLFELFPELTEGFIE